MSDFSLGVVLAAMRAHKGHASVQLYGCGCVMQLVLTPSNGVVFVAKAGGIEDVVTAIRTHKRSANVQQNGFRALCRVADSCDDVVAILFAKAGALLPFVFACAPSHQTQTCSTVVAGH